MARRPKRVEIGLRVEDMVTLRGAGRLGRAALLNRLRDLKGEMQVKISTIEKVDDALGRLDVAIAKAEAAYGVQLNLPADAPAPAQDSEEG